jgi:putative hydrolase of the HAD superfamily
MIDAGTRAVFFDAVGTLLFPRTPVARTYAEHACRHGANMSEEQVRHAFREAFARQEQLDLAAGWRTDEARERTRWRAIVADVLPAADAEPCFAGLWDWFADPAAWSVHPEAAEILTELSHRGLSVGIGSNFDARLLPLVDHFPELAPVRGRCVVSSLVGWRKPAPEFFAALAGVAGCEPAQVLYVGDDPRNDLEGATAAGLRAVLLDPDADRSHPARIRSLRDLTADQGLLP